MPSLKDQYDFNDFAEWDFGGGYWLRLGRSGLKPFQDHMSAFYRKAKATPTPGFRQRAGRNEPSDDAVNDAMRDGIMAHLWGGGGLYSNPAATRVEDRGDLVSEVTEAEFRERLYNEEDLEFFTDVVACIGHREVYRRKVMEEAAKNSQPSSEPSFA
jgi:hypothetical protein